MGEPLSDDTLARLRGLLEYAATPRPWSLDPVADDIEGPEQQSVTASDALEVAFCYREDAELAVAAVNALPALLDTNDRLTISDEEHREVTSVLRVDLASAERRLSTLIGTVRDVAEGLAMEPHTSASAVALAATTLHTACNRAERSTGD